MADKDGIPSDLWQSAYLSLQEWIATSIYGARTLETEEVAAYKNRDFVAGWRLPCELDTAPVEFNLLLSSRFPWRAPKIAAVDQNFHLHIPHVESDGVLCLLQEHAETDPFQPLETVKRLLYLAATLVNEGLTQKNRVDFQAEFRSYWPDDAGGKTVHSLLDPAGPSRFIHVWKGRSFCIAGESEAAVVGWMQNRFDRGKPAIRTTVRGVYIALKEALFPDEYPSSAKHVLQLVEKHAPPGLEYLLDVVADSPDEIMILIGATTLNGMALGAISLSPPRREYRGPGKTRVDRLGAGFRPGKVPRDLIAKRLLGGQAVVRSRVDRVDAAWIHGRGADSRQKTLATKSVAVIGCGSVGAAVANHLAQAGVSRLVLIDPDILSWANIGRHVLGGPSVNTYKAESLEQNLRGNFPHMRDVVSRSSTWQQVAKNSPELLIENDLIISTVGSWSEEGSLNEWHLSSRGRPPILYGWTEAHAAAGHAVTVRSSGGCLGCGLSNFGVPKLRVTDWGGGISQLQEPACGAVYQPYGPIELAHINALIAGQALQVLLDIEKSPRHVIWCSSHTLVASQGGYWTPEWQAIAGERTAGGFVEQRDWPISANCPLCKGAGV